MNEYQITRAGAEILLGIVGIITLLDITDIDDFLEVMVELEEFVVLPYCSKSTHLSYILGLDDLDEDY